MRLKMGALLTNLDKDLAIDNNLASNDSKSP